MYLGGQKDDNKTSHQLALAVLMPLEGRHRDSASGNQVRLLPVLK
jgi:hypothetical protein